MRNIVLALSCLVITSACSSTPPTEGPRVRPDDGEWRRKPVAIPPLYVRWRSGTGQNWKMITPLYWQVKGEHSRSDVLVPVYSRHEDRPARTRKGHVLNWAWKSGPEESYQTLFPLYWNFRSPESETSLYGPFYTKHETNGDVSRKRSMLFPWLYSRETSSDGYDYWGVCFRLLGMEKQYFGGEQHSRLWLLFFFPVQIS